MASSKELGLEDNLVPPSMGSSNELDLSDVFVAPPPPSIGNLSISTVPSTVFDSWDFSSKESLSSDEVQAVMIALAAEQQEAEQLWRNEELDDDDSDDGFSSTVKRKLPPPPDVRERDVAIQHLPCNDATQILVTLGGKITKYGTPSKRNICQDTPQNPMHISTRLQSLPPISEDDKDRPGRPKRASIKPLNDVDGRRTRAQSAREVSVHPLLCDEDTQYVVTLPSTASKGHQRPTLGARYLSIKRNSPAGAENHRDPFMMKTRSVPALAVSGKERRPCLSKHRQVAARFNDGKDMSLEVDF